MSWQRKTLGEICDEIGGQVQTGPFGSQLHQHDYKQEGTPVVMPKDIVEGRIDDQTIARIGGDDVKRLSKHILQYGDIVYPRRGDISKRAFVTQEQAGWICGTGCLRIRLNEKFSSRFLYYYLSLSQVVRDIENKAVGSTMLNLSTEILRSIDITIPPLSVQQRIVDILSAYDDLIENNLRRIQLLEEAARCRYKLMMDEVAAGQIDLTALCRTITDGTHDSPKPQESGRYLITGKHIRDGFIDFSTAYKISEADHQKIQERSSLDKGDILYSNIGTLGNVALVCGETDYSVKNVVILKPRDLHFSHFLYYYLSDRHILRQFMGEASGTSQKFLSLKFFRSLRIPHIPDGNIESFSSFVSPMVELRQKLHAQNGFLCQARDILLPRLMSGEIDVTSVKALMPTEEPLEIV